MSTSQGRTRSSRTAAKHTGAIARVAFVVLAVTVVVSSTAAMAGLEPEVSETGPDLIDATQSPESLPAAEDATQTINAQLIRTEVPSPTDDCSDPFSDDCAEVVAPEQEAIAHDANATACAISEEHTPTGALAVVPGTPGDTTAGNTVRLRIEVEEGLAIDADCFATTAIEILTDERGWTTVENVGFVQVDDDSYDLRLILASPATTDALCHPANTGGRYSCRNGDRVIINLMRWESGTDDYKNNLSVYRHYLLNHEVGHFLGKGHMTCQTPGEPAPVMMQQTKGLGECLPNGWPTEVER